MDLRTYLTQVVGPGEPHDVWAADWLRRLTRWFFEFAANVMIVGVIKYVADTTTAPILDYFYWVALGMLFLYAYSITNMELQIRPFVFMGDNMASRVLNHLFNFGLGVALFLFAVGAIYVAVNAISKVQG